MRFGIGVHEPAGYYVFAPVEGGAVRPQLTSIEEDACSFSSLSTAIMFASQVRKQFGLSTHVYVTNE